MTIITSIEEFNNFDSQLDKSRLIALDCETFGQRPTQVDAKLLGLAIAGYSKNGIIISAYIVFNHYDKLSKQFNSLCSSSHRFIDSFVKSSNIGWNVAFDSMWISAYLGDINFYADGRILWHLQNNDISIRGFGLKLAQKKLLGWDKSNDKALEDNVKSYGGLLSKGDHYLADLDVLASYACLDVVSTLEAVEKLLPWFKEREYMWFHNQILKYSLLLNEAGTSGIPISTLTLISAQHKYSNNREKALHELQKICSDSIGPLEESWKVQRLSEYKTERGRTKFLNMSDRWRKFNPGSSAQRAVLLHTMYELPVQERTPTGQPKTDRANLALLKHEAAKLLIKYSENKKIVEQAQTIINHTVQNMLYTSYDVCGTVTGRLAGFKPSLLNLPFSEDAIMRCFVPRDGFVGIHADLAAIEPCLLAHYSEDPYLLKVYKEGKGDIYLDLGLELFPNNEEFRREYDPDKPIDSGIKEKFKDIRSVCKTVHLAVSYTGTHITVAKNLTKSGYPTTKEQAMRLVGRYWNKFKRVKQFDRSLHMLYDQQKELRNISGRVVQVPREYKKDLMNRLIQSSAHDILRLWVMEIVNQFKIQGIKYYHWLPDIHDSTTLQVEPSNAEQASEIFKEALSKVVKTLGILIPVKCEIKIIKNLAGVKGG